MLTLKNVKDGKELPFLHQDHIDDHHHHPAAAMTKTKKKSLLEMAEMAMSQSMLVFLLADLRSLSSTGQIRTKFENLCLDNDRAPRLTSRDYAGFNEYRGSRGLTSAHIMAVLIIEITREANEVKNDKRKGKDVRTPVLGVQGDDVKRGFSLGRRDIKAASGMHALLHCYNAMVASDIASDTHRVRKSEYPMDHSAAEKWDLVRASFKPEVVDKGDEGLMDGVFSSVVTAAGERLKEQGRRAGLAMTRNQGHRLNATSWEIVNTQNSMLSRLSLINPSDTIEHSNSEFYSQDELVGLLEQALKKRDGKSLGFMKNFFKEGTVSRVLAESKAEMVWLSDWNNTHECTYAISIDREEKNVLLSFRGAYTKTDWAHAFNFKELATSNPIKDDYPNRPDNIRFHSGFHGYLFRVRKDTETTKYDEIVAKLIYYFQVVGEGVRLTVTGHSLGAALATVFTFYASTDERFTRNGAIETITFGAPLIGGYKFADAFRHQENAGKLRLAKFRVVADGVASLPPTLVYMSKRGARYFHSGINITLPMVRKGIFETLIGQPQPSVTYNGPKVSFIRSWLRQVREFYFWNLPLRIWLASYMHTLVEHKKRINLINKSKADHEKSPLVRYSLEELYERRDELRQKY